jgi:hypothetical protein
LDDDENNNEYVSENLEKKGINLNLENKDKSKKKGCC